MPALNFKKQFIPLIENGDKDQTIRQLKPDKKNRFKVGDTLYLYTGLRTKHSKLIGTARVSSLQKVWFYFVENQMLCYIEKDGVPHPLTGVGLRLLAAYDGFGDDVVEFLTFFRKNYGDLFDGQIIIWKEFKKA